MRSTKRTTIAITIICLVGLLSFPLHAESCDEWPMLYNNPQHTNYTECKLPSEMEVLWSRRTGGVIRSSPIVADNKLYIVLGDHNLYCLNAETGKKLWKYEIGGELSSLFLGESSSIFLGKLSPSPCVINGKVYVGSLDGNIYCIDAETGEKRWSYQTKGVIQSSPIVVGNNLYIGSADHNLYCINAETGKKRWTHEIDTAVYSSPAFYNNRIYVASRGYLYCVDASIGEELWKQKMEITHDSVLIGDGKLYAAGYTRDGRGIYCLDTETGKMIWKNTDIKVPDSLALGNKRIYLSIWMDKASSIYCLDADTGGVLWKYTEEEDKIFLSLVVADNRLYVRVTPSYLYCIDAETGEKLWEYKKELLAWHTPIAIANGKIYAASSNIYCIGPKKDTIPLYFIVLIFTSSIVGVLLWKKRETLKKVSLAHNLMLLIGIFSLSPVSLLWFQEAVSFTEWFTFFTILYWCLIAISSLAILLFVVEEFWKSIVSLFFSFYIPFSVSFFIGMTIPIVYSLNEDISTFSASIIGTSVFIPSVIYLLLVLLSSTSLLLSNRGKNRVRLVISPFLFFFALFLITIYIFNENPSDAAMVFIPFMVIVPTIVYLAHDKVLQWKEKERKNKLKEEA